ncbi:hypothetical protein BDV23DRAFT_54050 [Aspergillus alliaceus]|uniref:Integrase zinc-binding domain-containing protein n=1 Tax=Petromyces alliaceus TaxID=209559 RepID=A0A5N7BQT5_PETAA|nr:hypothetical protein BDV23DRAFT_54050 [Aspergillus alliaceus]
MKGSPWLFGRNCSRFSLEHTNNASTVAETKHLPRSDRSTHGTSVVQLNFVVLVFFLSFSSNNSMSIYCLSGKLTASYVDHHQRVPKELISRFVKICPTCQVRRGGSRLTPPNSRRSSPRLEIVSRSPKLPSPPMSRCESNLNVQLPLDRSQANYLSQLSGHNSWLESQKGINPRPNMSPRHTFTKVARPLPSSISTGLDALHGDVPDPSSQINYNPGFTPAHGSSSHRDFQSPPC